MRILFVCKTLPHEMVIGGPVIIYNRILLLSLDHQVSLLTFVPEDEKEHSHTVSRFCLDFEEVPMPGPRSAMSKAKAFLHSEVPNYFLNGYSEEMYVKLAGMLSRQPYDVVISEYSMAAQYLYRNPDLERRPEIKRVMSVHECYYLARRKALQVQRFSREGLSALFYLKGLKRFEFDMYRSADKLLVLTPEGRDELAQIAPDLDIEVVPHGVDLEKFQVPEARSGEPVVMFLGNYPHDPNRDAVVYFAESIWPLVRESIPGARFLVVGKDPTPDILDLAERDPSIEVTGTVEDVRPYFERSALFVCPVRIGGGFRGKVLEAMAMGLPVVSTSLGAEGIPVRDGEDMLIADDPEGFASGVIRLIGDQGLRDRLGENARRMVEERFSWEKGVEELEAVLLEVVGGPGGSP